MSANENEGNEGSPSRLSQIFESLVDFQSTKKGSSSPQPEQRVPHSSLSVSPKPLLQPGCSTSSAPCSPRLLSKRRPIQQKPNAALIANPLLYDSSSSSSSSSPWNHPISSLTESLNVHQVNNYQHEYPEINWQERCLELQLELHRSRNQAGRVRDMLKEKMSELERRVIEAEQRASSAEQQVRVMEQKLCDWSTGRPNTDSEKTISQLLQRVDEQKQLRLQDARIVEEKAAKIKLWVTNKLRDLEEQNQLLREQNIKCNQQLKLLKNHIQGGTAVPSRASLSLDVQEFRQRQGRRRSESLDSPGSKSLAPDLRHYHRRNLSMEPQELARDLACAVEDLSVSPRSRNSPQSSDVEGIHDYAEIYTPSVEKTPAWLRGPSERSSTTSDSITEFAVATAMAAGTTTTMTTAISAIGEQTRKELTSFAYDVNQTHRPPTPPLHRFPSWEEKIYQVATEGLTGTDSKSQASESSASKLDRSQVTSASGYCDISVPVYATVKGRASQIRSMPFSGESTDESSEGEDNNGAIAYTMSTHNSSSTDNTESSVSGSASSPSKSLSKTASHQSPAKRTGSESPKARIKSDRLPIKEAIGETSVDSALSDDYAIPPDAFEIPAMETIVPSLLMRTSYVDSPNKKIDTLEKSGHLIKLSGKLKTWRKRYFVLKNGTLCYWKTQHDVNRKPQGQIMLDENCKITRAEGATTFEIDTGKKVYYLTADSSASMDDWVKTLQNVQRRNATKLLLSREDQKPTIQGWVTKVKNGHPKKCWCVLLGKMFLYFKSPGEASPTGQINMRDAKVEEVEYVSDSDSEEREDSQNQAKLTIAIYPQHQGPTYLILANKQERDAWLYHLTVVSGGARNAGTQYEQLIQKLMETDGDPNCVIWRHPVLLHTKDNITSPLTSLENETLQSEAIKLFKSCQLFMSVAVSQPAIDYHVVLAQNALQLCLDTPKLQSELICALVKQTSPHTSQKLSAGVQASLITPIDCKSNPPSYSFIQGWQLLALAVSLFVPKNNRLLWYLKLHLSRNSDAKTECGKYAIYCERALQRTMQNGDREAKPSRMEVLSILLKNPYHHSLPHAIPVHFMNGGYQVVSFDGSTTIEEFQNTLAQEIGCRDYANGFTIFSDDPIEKDLEHYLDRDAKVCDVISKWETALREKGSGKFENSRVIQLTYKNRLYWRGSAKMETEKERLLFCYQINQQIVQGRFPLTKELALELASLMAQIDMGDYTTEKVRSSSLHALDKFYPYRYRDALASTALQDLQNLLAAKWQLLKGKSVTDCVRIYLTCARKWPFFGAALFQAKPRHSDQAMAWLAVAEDALSILELSSMILVVRYPYSSIVTFGGCQDDFMVVISSDDGTETGVEQKLLFALSKPKILELTLLIADYMNALGHSSGTPQANTLTRNGSRRSIRSRTQLGSISGIQGNDTLTSHATFTLNSQNSLALSSSHGQPDIIKSTPDHRPTKRN